MTKRTQQIIEELAAHAHAIRQGVAMLRRVAGEREQAAAAQVEEKARELCGALEGLR